MVTRREGVREDTGRPAVDVQQEGEIFTARPFRQHHEPLDLGPVSALPRRQAALSERDLLCDPWIGVRELHPRRTVGRPCPNVGRRVEVLNDVRHHRAVSRERAGGQGPHEVRDLAHRPRTQV